MTMTHTASTDALRFGTPVRIVLLNAVLTTGLMVTLKLQGFGWLLALILGSFGGAGLTVLAVCALVTLLSAHDTQDRGSYDYR